MIDTVDSVFGTDTTEPAIPDEILERLKPMIEEFGIEKDQLKTDFVAVLTRPEIAAHNKARFTVAYHTYRALQQRNYIKSGGRPFEFMPVSVSRKPYQDKKKGGFNLRAFGLIRSLDDNYEFEGPANIQISGFPDESTGQTYASHLEVGAVFKLTANPSNKSPAGKIAGGNIGFLFSDATGTPDKVASPDAFWGQAAERLIASFPTTNMAELLLTPKPNTMYRVAGEIFFGRLSVNPKDNSQSGSIRIMDDTVTGELAKQSSGGLFMFLPSEHTHIAGLPVGSRIEALIDGYFRADKTANNENTGGGQWVWNAHSIKTVIDLSQGTEIPNAEKPAVNIPSRINAVKRF